MHSPVLRSRRAFEEERARSVRIKKEDILRDEQERAYGEDAEVGGSESEVGGDSDEFVFEVRFPGV